MKVFWRILFNFRVLCIWYEAGSSQISSYYYQTDHHVQPSGIIFSSCTSQQYTRDAESNSSGSNSLAVAAYGLVYHITAYSYSSTVPFWIGVNDLSAQSEKWWWTNICRGQDSNIVTMDQWDVTAAVHFVGRFLGYTSIYMIKCSCSVLTDIVI